MYKFIKVIRLSYLPHLFINLIFSSNIRIFNDVLKSIYAIIRLKMKMISLKKLRLNN
jgi:hypothetical protein